MTTDKDLQKLRERVRCITGECPAEHDNCTYLDYDTGDGSTPETDKLMALFTKAYRAKLQNLVTQANEFGAKAGSLEVGYAHLRDLMQKELES